MKKILEKNRFYNRETIAAWNYQIHQMSLIYPLTLYATKTIKPFLYLRISANHYKGEVKSIYKKDCVSIVKSLLLESYMFSNKNLLCIQLTCTCNIIGKKNIL